MILCVTYVCPILLLRPGVKKLQDFKFGPKLTSLPLAGVDMELVKSDIALMWRYRNHRKTCILIFSKPRGEGEFDMVIDVVKSADIYVRAENHYSVGFKMVGESQPLAIKTGRFLSFIIDGPLIVEKCEGGVTSGQALNIALSIALCYQGDINTRTLYFSHGQINSIEYAVKRPQVEEVKGPASKKGKKKEEVKVDSEPDARLEVMGLNAGSSTNGVDLAALSIWLTGPDLWKDRHVKLRTSDNRLLNPLTECLTRSRALAKNWWRLLILLGFPEKDVEKEKGRTDPKVVVGMKTNERVLNEANKRRSLVRTLRKRQATFLGHVMRRGTLEHLVTTGQFEGKRSRGRQREKIMDGLATWLGPGKVSDILAAVKDRDLWRDMIANAYKQGT
ncbi:hypothetical protein PoB_003379000 [Plakobranchus ocellatus]|uniref:Uncharacterized protein n=1 Tax=Plakobranchus ocellatus TaxID=259542 RepID=A0AAV4AGJ0_9GAST|nr:hypothetical protein PoB_003379000 [Plakobranchus ocellatus]